MSDITTIITSIGASGLLSAGLFFLLREWLSTRLKSAIQHEYDQKLEAHKSKLQYENETAIERLRSELHIAATERNVKITKLHEEMALTIAKAFELLNNVRIAVLDFTKPIEMSGEPSKDEKKATLARRMTELEDYFFPRQIYLPRDIAMQVHALRVHCTDTAYHYLDSMSGHFGNMTAEEWHKTMRDMKEKIQTLMKELETEFRRLLGFTN